MHEESFGEGGGEGNKEDEQRREGGELCIKIVLAREREGEKDDETKGWTEREVEEKKKG